MEPKDAAALAAWTDQHRAVFDLVLDAWAIVDTDNRIVECNPAFEELADMPLRRLKKLDAVCEALTLDGCPENCPTRRVLSSGTPLRIDEVRGKSPVHPKLRLILASVPVLDNTGRTVGAMVTLRDVTAEEQLLKKYDVTRKESIVDGLTGVHNRAYIEAQLQLAIKTYFRQLQQFSVVLCDIDHFKKINDTFGHQAGDAVLRAFANTLKAASRDTDLIGRYGGEEFLVILPKCAPAGAEVFCERLRRRTEALKLTHGGQIVSATVSLGTASFEPTWPNSKDVSPYAVEIVRRADQALYRAKATGRNRTVVYEIEIAPPDTQSAAAS